MPIPPVPMMSITSCLPMCRSECCTPIRHSSWDRGQKAANYCKQTAGQGKGETWRLACLGERHRQITKTNTIRYGFNSPCLKHLWVTWEMEMTPRPAPWLTDGDWAEASVSA